MGYFACKDIKKTINFKEIYRFFVLWEDAHNDKWDVYLFVRINKSDTLVYFRSYTLPIDFARSPFWHLADDAGALLGEQ